MFNFFISLIVINFFYKDNTLFIYCCNKIFFATCKQCSNCFKCNTVFFIFCFNNADTSSCIHIYM